MPAEGWTGCPTSSCSARRTGRRLTSPSPGSASPAVRFTGGEPLLARHLESVIAAAAALEPRPEISLTTNGVGLARRAAALAEAGLDRVNVSLDSVNRDRFTAITRRDRLADVLAGLAAAGAAGLAPVKVNAVLDPHTGREDVVDLLGFASSTVTSCGLSNRCRWTPATSGAEMPR